jgi:putative transposase
VILSLLYLLLRRVLGLVQSDDRIAAEAELEIAVLRHQVAILRRQVKRPIYRTSDKGVPGRDEQDAPPSGVALVPGTT